MDPKCDIKTFIVVFFTSISSNTARINGNGNDFGLHTVDVWVSKNKMSQRDESYASRQILARWKPRCENGPEKPESPFYLCYSILLLQFVCRKHNRLYLVCSVWPIFPLLSDAVRASLSVRSWDCGGWGYLMNRERALMLLKGGRSLLLRLLLPPLPPFKNASQVTWGHVMTVNFPVTNVCDYFLGGRSCVLNKGQCDSRRSRFHSQTASKNKEHKPEPQYRRVFRLVAFWHWIITQINSALSKKVCFS